MKKTMLFCAVMLGLMACNPQKKNETEEATPQKILVLYYSQTGTTKAVAEEIQKMLGADIEAISLENDYPRTSKQPSTDARRNVRQANFLL